MRFLYGGTAADVTTLPTGRVRPGVQGTAWFTRDGLDQATDLATLAGAPTPFVVSEATGMTLFYGPDGYSGPLWLDFGLGYRTLTQPVQREQGRPAVRWKAGSVVPWNYGAYANLPKILEHVEASGFNAVTIPVAVAADNIYDSTPVVDGDRLEWAQTIAAALPSDVAVIAEPYPWVDNGNQSETLWVPTDVPQWFDSWGAACVEVAEAFPGAAMCYVGSNMVSLEGGNSAEWSAVAAAVRAVTDAKVSYRCNWWFEDARLDTLCAWPFLQDLDVVSVASYFELTSTAVPGGDEVAACLEGSLIYGRNQNVVSDVTALHDATGADVFFGELVTSHFEHSLSAPWNPNPTIPGSDPPTASTARDPMIQARFYKAYVDAFAPLDWWVGFSVYGMAGFDDSGYVLDIAARTYLKGLQTVTW